MGEQKRHWIGSILFSSYSKLALAVIVLIVLVKFNRVDLNKLGDAISTPGYLILALLIVLPSYFIVSLRFQVILRGLGAPVRFRRALSWTMIGAYFDLGMPSSNGGDLVKAGYVVEGLDRQHRYVAVMAVLVDRVIGVIGLFSLAFGAAVLSWDKLSGFPQREELAFIALSLSVVPLFVLRAAGSRRLFSILERKLSASSSNPGRRLLQIFTAFNLLRENIAMVALALLLSILNHLFWASSVFLIASSVGETVGLANGFLVFPLAIFGGVFGVAGGFGLGTAVFDLILTSTLRIENGGTIGLIFQLLGAVSRMFGLAFYLMEKPSKAHLEDTTN